MRTIQAVVAVALVSVVALAGAQPMRGRGMGGWAAPGLWDPKTVETVQGTVKSIDVIKTKGMAEGIHVTLATATANLPVHLGPAWYIDHQDLKLAVGDKVTIRGSRITYEGKPALIAAEVTRGQDVMVLRNDQGFPRWAAWRRRPASS